MVLGAGAMSKLSTVISNAGIASLLPGETNMEGNQQQGAQVAERCAQKRPAHALHHYLHCLQDGRFSRRSARAMHGKTWEWGLTQPPHYLESRTKKRHQHCKERAAAAHIRLDAPTAA